MRGLLCLGMLACGVSAAGATGGFDCVAEDAAVRLAVSGSVTRGMGGPIYMLSGEIRLSAPDVPADLRSLSFDRSHAAQYWFDGEEFRLLLYRERGGEPFGSAELTIRTRSTDELTYVGEYVLGIFDMTGGEDRTLELKGDVSCSGE